MSEDSISQEGSDYQPDGTWTEPAIAWETVPLMTKAQSDALFMELRHEDNLEAFLNECLSIRHPYNDTTVSRLPGPHFNKTKSGYYNSRNPEFPVSVSPSGWWWDTTKAGGQPRSADSELFGLWQMTHNIPNRAQSKLECREWLRKRKAGELAKAEREAREAERQNDLLMRDKIDKVLPWTRRGTCRGNTAKFRKTINEAFRGDYTNTAVRVQLEKWWQSDCQHRFTVQCKTRSYNHHTWTCRKTGVDQRWEDCEADANKVASFRDEEERQSYIQRKYDLLMEKLEQQQDLAEIEPAEQV